LGHGTQKTGLTVTSTKWEVTLELDVALRRKMVKLGFAAGLCILPLSGEESPVLQAVQRRIERALLDLQNVTGDLLDSLRDGVAVNRAQQDHFQDQQVQRSLW